MGGAQTPATRGQMVAKVRSRDHLGKGCRTAELTERQASCGLAVSYPETSQVFAEMMCETSKLVWDGS